MMTNLSGQKNTKKKKKKKKKKKTGLRKGNFKKETDSLLITAQVNAIRTNHIKARTYKRLQNSKCRLCSDRDETINHIIRGCSKLPQKEHKTRLDWVGKLIHWDICKQMVCAQPSNCPRK